MAPEQTAHIEELIGLAFSLASNGADAAATSAFAAARELAVRYCDPTALATRIRNHNAPLINERERYRALIAAERLSSKRLVILADSLGLPRPDAKEGAFFGADSTYPMLVLKHLPEHSVESCCQRYFTTESVVSLLSEERELGRDADVVVHVGLNDCATRMFLEPQRLALELLDSSLSERIVKFAQTHRRKILERLPELHYVDRRAFESNLDTIVRLLNERGAHRVVLTTTILPPAKFWPATPGVNRNFASYNLAIMEAAERSGAILFDLDRHVWSRQHEGALLADGMHLSAVGHELFARELASLLK